MRPLLQHAQRSLIANAGASKHPTRSFSHAVNSVSRASSVCLQCQCRASVAFRSSRRPQWPSFASSRRSLHQPSDDGKSKPDNETPEERLARVRADIALRERQEKERLEKERLEFERKEKERLEKERKERERQEKERQERERLEEERRDKEREARPQKKSLPDVVELGSPTPTTGSRPSPHVAEASSSTSAPTSTNEWISSADNHSNRSTRDAMKDNIERVAADQLPSHHQAQRWDLSKRFQDLMDDVLPKLAVVTHKVNTYTGTDYSGIEALKREIKDQEKLVKTRRAAIEEAKQALDVALSKQASAQKEVVALLERKHSWSDSDLERYMSLIRSEHINDQAVREAKDSIAQAENALEEARSRLEKRERAQYHEEQIWSDTIRRNSTWVTFGLMGLNIFLLLATMIVIEPWRRRRMVREIRATLEAQKPAAVEPLTAAATPIVAVGAEKVAEKLSAPVIKSPAIVEVVDTASPIQQGLNASSEQPAKVTEAPPAVITPSPDPAEVPAIKSTAPLVTEEIKGLPESIKVEEEVRSSAPSTPESWQDRIAYIATDMISERTISMRRIDYTAAILQGAAAGAVITAAVVAIILHE
ncbi:hypothetical protein PMIN07_004352 [Paraphaeosphaeria minitans]